jgi:hypothetical protein
VNLWFSQAPSQRMRAKTLASTVGTLVTTLTAMFVATLGATLAQTNSGTNATQTTVFHLDLQQLALGPLSESAVREHWRLSSKVHLGNRAQIVRDGSRRVLRLAYPRGGVGPQQTGGVFVAVFMAGAEYYLSYRVKLDEGFDFKKGGKLPGLSSSRCKYSGGRVPKDGAGWSARLVWGPDGAVAVYLYHFGMKGPWGDTLHLGGGKLQKGRWHRIIERVRLNAGDKANGILQVWLDGDLRLDRQDIRYRLGDKGRIDSLCFSTFHGGHTDEYAPRTDGHAFFDDMFVSAQPPAGAGTRR